MSATALLHGERIHPLSGEVTNRVMRPTELGAMRGVPSNRLKQIKAGYDAARTTTEFKNYWANADHLSSDAANNKGVRQTLVARSRYEVANNGYVDGIVQTFATDLVGVGPKLRMQTGTHGFNQAVEVVFAKWAKAIKLRRKLWCMAHAKVQDGESFAIIRNNPKVKHRVQLDLVLIETEMCQTYVFGGMVENYIDGIKFDDFGNPEHYDILRHHPSGPLGFDYQHEPEKVPAEFVLHWFLLRRPGQHRGVPEMRSTLNVGASSRRFREATVGAAETAAEFTTFLKTSMQPDELQQVTPMSTLDIQKRMMTALPQGWEASQMRAEHPNATYDSFVKSQVGEQARPLSMPFNKAACDSSTYNYASGRLDHQTYYGALDVQREDGNDLVLDPLFDMWWQEAVLAYGWNADPNNPPTHTWDWSEHQAADVTSEAAAADQRLRNGSLSLSQYYAEKGEDFDDVLPDMANDYFGDDSESGMTQEERNKEMRTILRNSLFNAQNQQASMEQAAAQQTAQKAAKSVAQHNSNTGVKNV